MLVRTGGKACGTATVEIIVVVPQKFLIRTVYMAQLFRSFVYTQKPQSQLTTETLVCPYFLVHNPVYVWPTGERIKKMWYMCLNRVVFNYTEKQKSGHFQ